MILVDLLDPESRKKYEFIFKQLDVDGNGSISRQELLDGFCLTQMQIERNNMGDEVDKIWQKLNLKEDQEIGLTEWLTMAIDRETLCTQENMEKAFNYFDTDQGGSITPDELKEKLRIQEGGSDAQIWKEIIDEVD